MIVQDTATLRKYISVNGTVDHANVAPYLRKAERLFLKPAIGKEQFDIFDGSPTDDVIKEGLELAQEAICNYGYYLYLLVNAVEITNRGIVVSQSESSRPASDKQFKELQRSFKKSAHEALDELLEFMEEFPDKFPEWFASSTHTVYKNLLVNKASIFNEYYYIFKSRQTFAALKPTITTVEDQFIKQVIGNDLLLELYNNQNNANRKEVKVLLQKAVVAFTVMKVVDNGMFVLSAEGMHMRFDTLPYEKVVTNVNLKINDFLIRTKSNKKIEGEEYLKQALDIMLENTTDFPEYTPTTSETTSDLIITKSIVGM